MPTIAELLSIRPRLFRSVELERDFEDPAALAGYVLTPTARGHIERLATALLPNSTRRAWRVTGDYGSGKSTFGLLLARLLCGRSRELPQGAASAADWAALGCQPPHLLPIVVTGTRAGIAAAVLRGMDRALRPLGGSAQFRRRIAEARETTGAEREKLVLDRLEELHVRAARWDYGGILLILDEVGKFLEAAALDPQRHDIYFLQQLAEMAARSGERPFIVVGLLHQGFHAYAEALTGTAQREWEKVAGRFEELVFDSPLEETAELVAGALQVDTARLPNGVVDAAREAMAQAYDFGWYGMANRERLIACAPRLFPLHPMTLPVLARVFARFGQNQRSLFTFLVSPEPHGIQDFAQREAGDEAFYRLDHLFDHVRASLGQRLLNRALRSHWLRVVGTIEALSLDDALEIRILKTVALLNVVDDERLLPRGEIVAAALASSSGREEIARSAEDMHGRRILHVRGTAGGFRLWPHSSVDLERAYDESVRALGSVECVSAALQDYLDSRPLVARRHYIETGNLRYFEIRYVSVRDLSRRLDRGPADGVIVVVLCDSEDERREAIDHVLSADFADRKYLLAAVPRTLSALKDAVEEVQRWEWVVANTPELSHDSYAAEEVSRHVSIARRVLTNRIRNFVGLHACQHGEEIAWYWSGGPIDLSGGSISPVLSDICSDLYTAAPHVHNELVNRAALSGAAAGARMRIIEGVLERSTEPFLGIDSSKAPPEKSVYYSLFQEGGLHRHIDGVWTIAEPPADDDRCRLLPLFRHLREVLSEALGERRSAAELMEALRKPPFGVRDGLIPILLAVFARVQQSQLAIYEDGEFLLDLTGFEFMRLIKAPGTFEFQLCPIVGVRAEVFGRIAHVLEEETALSRGADLVEAVTALAKFAAELPEFARRTRRISDRAQQVREVLLGATDPPELLFTQLPIACGFEPFGATASPPSKIEGFTSALRSVMGELRGAYLVLRDEITRQLAAAFELPADLSTLQAVLSSRAAAVRGAARESNLIAFCSRLGDTRLSPLEWLDSVASVPAGKPPMRWHDADAELFAVRLYYYSQQFSQALQVALGRGDMDADVRGVSVSLTDEAGHQRAMPVFFVHEEGEIEPLMQAVREPLAKVPRELRIATLSKLLWTLLDEAPDSRPEAAVA